MHELLQSGAITEVQNSQNVTYLINDDSLFMLTGYKVLKSQTTSGFIKCAKLLHNGKIKLVYFTSGQRTLESIMPSLNADTFLPVLKEFLSIILEINNNGFLYCQNLDLSLDKIFIDQSNLTANLIYLQLNSQPVEFAVFENKLRKKIIQLISSAPSLKASGLGQVCAELSNTSGSMSNLYEFISDAIQPELMFSAMDDTTRAEFRIKKPEFLIGRNASCVDGVLGANRAFGRVHCKIVFQRGSYGIVDLGSINGTYVNESLIAPQETRPIKNGDVVRIADSSFLIRI